MNNDRQKEYEKYNVKNLKCDKCGNEHASKRFFTKKILCNECAHKEFVKYLAALPVIATLIFIALQII